MVQDRLLNEFIEKEEVVVRVLEKWADAIGDRIFFYYGEEDQALTYRQFNAMTNQIARNLMAQGVEKGDRVCVFLKNPLVTTLAMLGIWKAGGVFSPVNFNYHGKLLSYQINDTRPRLIISEREMVPQLNAIKEELERIPVIVYDPREGDHDYHDQLRHNRLDPHFPEIPFDRMLEGDDRNLDIPLHYWDTANIVYTSGTTGPAKGVVQSYRWMHGYTYGLRVMLTQEDVIYNDLPLYHVGGAFANVIRALYVGCTVAVWDKFSPGQFWERIRTSGASTAILLDVMIPWLMKAEPSPNDRLNTLNKVYMQPLPQYYLDVAKRFAFDFVLAGFGQTESGNGFRGIIQALDADEGTPPELYKGYSREEFLRIAERYGVPVRHKTEQLEKGFMGKPSFFLEAVILNERDEPCAPGEMGEIAFRPKVPYLFLTEYFGKPEATAKTFRNFWFHTGDAGYMDEDGTFYFVDRMGNVIRRRGENISSYQIEDILNGHPEVEMSAAFPIPADEGDEDEIVAFVVRKEGSALTEEGLRRWIEAEMPRFMWPKYIRLVEEIPRTPTNKIEKYKLREEILREVAGE
ncbi:MAG: acyl-CoA synthetase [Bacillus thermozeamaize]|uniref:Acyl-CoA synthetase n=1 Tax=Bacillus thermozeamaize TaxID=230954 RepID=A0A1Y3PSN5_9BACI|nr:MAG: acyl-CoA synthetase [Bacillus thermozeamaize]